MKLRSKRFAREESVSTDGFGDICRLNEALGAQDNENGAGGTFYKYKLAFIVDHRDRSVPRGEMAVFLFIPEITFDHFEWMIGLLIRFLAEYVDIISFFVRALDTFTEAEDVLSGEGVAVEQTEVSLEIFFTSFCQFQLRESF